MNTPQLRTQRGIALVVVLVFLVLLSVFVVGFFSNAQDELTAAQGFRAEISASHLSESAVAVVMGQIREATNRKNGAWGSQPGMIRVYRNGDNASPEPDAFFKLYSSNDMIVSGAEISKFDPTGDVDEGGDIGWNHVPAMWTDLNQPVYVDLPNSQGGTTRVARYPILDPTLNQRVEGLEFLTTAKDDSKVQARMPVRWLYVLRDGTLTAPSSSGANGTQAIWKAGERAPTAANPIVGRVAFWTDDESCKVNVNTAGGYSLKTEVTAGDGGMPKFDKATPARPYTEDTYAGSFWDAPRALTEFEQGQIYSPKLSGVRVLSTDPADQPILTKGGLGLCQPVQGEFQRYPGHPSTTSLGILFRTPPGSSKISMQDAPYLLTSGQLAILAPRLQYALNPKTDPERIRRCSSYGTERLLAYDDRPPGLRVKRLYATVDELFFAQPDPDATKTNTSNVRTQSDVNLLLTADGTEAKTITPALLDKMRFFLTAHSRAPEMNLFGRPRMTIWPVAKVKSKDEEGNYWNASDRLLAFCSTIGPDSSKVDEDKVSRFLMQRETQRNNAASSWVSPSVDYSQNTRNQFLYRYLQTLTSAPIPGFGKSLESKYGKDDRDQILTEIFDYIRVVNLRDSTRDLTLVPNLRTTTNPDGTAATTAQFQQIEQYKYAPRGLVIPLKIGNTTGFGRFPGISEAALVIYHAGYQWGGELTGGGTRRFIASDGPKDSAGRVKRPDFDLVRAFLVFENFNPMQGFAPIASPDSRSIDANRGSIIYQVKGLDGFAINGKSLGFPATDTTGRSSGGAVNYFNHASGSFWHGRNSGGCEGFFHTLYKPIVGDSKTPAKYNAGISYNAGDGNANSVKQPTQLEDPTDWRFYQFQSQRNAPSMGADIDHPGIAIQIPPEDQEGLPRTMDLKGTDLEISIYFGNVANANRVSKLPVKLTFPDATVPVPYGGNLRQINNPDPNNGPEWRDPQAYWQTQGGGAAPLAYFPPPPDGSNGESQYWYGNYSTDIPVPNPLYTNNVAYAKSFAGRMFRIRNADSNNYRNVSLNKPGPNRTEIWRNILQPGDVVRSVVYTKGDLRAAMVSGDSSVYEAHYDYANSALRRACSLRSAAGALYFQERRPDLPGNLLMGNDTKFGNIAELRDGARYPASQAADLPASDDGSKLVNGVKRSDGKPGDFDTGIGNLSDGPYCNKPDEGNLAYRRQVTDINGVRIGWDYPTPYYTWVYEEGFDTFFSPNRQMPSAVLFGSLLAGKTASWQTLCFSPNPAGENHPGRIDPKDYLWLDLFHMPIVEPYAISEPFSTAGKVNMNYQIVPFGNIKRSTGLRAVLQPVRLTAFSVNDYIAGSNPKQLSFKTGSPSGTPLPQNYRYLVDRDETLKGFEDYFAEYASDKKSGFFKTAAQICDFYLYPKRANTQTLPTIPSSTKWTKGDTAIKAWWENQALTGDNMREKPYADLYARLTTKSNTYCVHVRAQALRQSAPTDATKAAEHYRVWNEKRDRVISEYRGSSIIERYIDPQDARFDQNSGVDKASYINVDGVASSLTSDSFENAYRFRVLNTKRFDP